MPIYALNNSLEFPDPERADANGLLAIGGDLRPERLMRAYSLGIFPWPCEGYPLMWHAPPERFVLAPTQLTIGRTLRKVLKRRAFVVTLDNRFEDVMRACSRVPRPGQDGTWIDEPMIKAYSALHRMGHAHSVEAWQADRLVGGLYGISLGKAFFGESMFALQANASKVAFATLVQQLACWHFEIVDAQVHTPLLASFGAVSLPRRDFSRVLAHALDAPSRPGPWRLDDSLRCGAQARHR